MAAAKRKAAGARGGSPYGVHPSVERDRKWIAALPERTGRSLAQWVALAKRAAPRDDEARRRWLVAEHGLGAAAASAIAECAAGRGDELGDPAAYLAAAERWVEAMFAGPKAGLRPIFELLVDAGRALGADVRVCPCSTIVPLFREHVFAQLKPATRTRLDLGVALGDTPAKGRLLDTGGLAKKDRITHRIALASVAEVDDEVRRWLRRAYERDGGGKALGHSKSGR